MGAMTLYTGDGLLAEEIAQEALIRACERWARVREMAAPGAWVHRVAMNLAKSRFRRLILERRVAAQVSVTDIDHDPEPDDVVALRDAIRRLSPRQREAFVLRYFVGFTIEETAATMKLTSGALRSLTHRAGQRLEAALIDRPGEVRRVV